MIIMIIIIIIVILLLLLCQQYFLSAFNSSKNWDKIEKTNVNGINGQIFD